MDKLWERFKDTVSTAWKTVIHAKKQFLPFFLAVILIEFAIFTVALTFTSSLETRRELLEEEYNYHLTVSGLTQHQYEQILHEKGQIGTWDIYTVVNQAKSKAEGYKNAYIFLKLDADTYSFIDRIRKGVDGSLDALHDEFIERYTTRCNILDQPDVVLHESPLFDCICFAITLIASVLSAYFPYLRYRKRFLAEQQQDALYQE